ncbi:MAG: nucleotidyl transferase AbiEii/AbiGii toxin family protein [Bacteroidia bacterium]
MEQTIRKLIELAQKVVPLFPSFYLAGGTNIMFKYRHRMSTDLDFFSYKTFSFNRIEKKILSHFSVEKIEKREDNVDFWIYQTKVSFVYFPFKNIEKTTVWNNIPLASDIDIFLNKIYVAGRRIDSKDIIDIAFLYSQHIDKWHFNLIKQLFEQKFPLQNFEIYLGAVFSLEDYPELPASAVSAIQTMQKNWLSL